MYLDQEEHKLTCNNGNVINLVHKISNFYYKVITLGELISLWMMHCPLILLDQIKIMEDNLYLIHGTEVLTKDLESIKLKNKLKKIN